MSRFRFRRSIGAAIAIAAALSVWTAVSAENKDRPFTLTSPALKDDAMLPAKYAGAGRCGGRNISPPLAWSNAPPSTRSFALMMIDPDGRRGIGSVHWIAYDIPASRHALKAGASSAAAKDIAGGKNSRGTMVYAGPCAPHADAPHHYIIQLIALDVAPGFLQPGLDHDELLTMINGHSLAAASLVLRYHRKP